MIYIIAGISSFLSGIGIGGGAVFILLSMLFKITDLNTAKTYNLLLFISVGIVISIKNFKIIKKEGKKYIKYLILLVVGAIFGTKINNCMPEKITRILFYIFMLIIGGYEIIVSLKQIKEGKNIIKKGEN